MGADDPLPAGSDHCASLATEGRAKDDGLARSETGNPRSRRDFLADVGAIGGALAFAAGSLSAPGAAAAADTQPQEKRPWSHKGVNGQLPVGSYSDSGATLHKQLEAILGRACDFKPKVHFNAVSWGGLTACPGNVKWFYDTHHNGIGAKGAITLWKWPGTDNDFVDRQPQFVQCAKNQLVEGKSVRDWLRITAENVLKAGFTPQRPLIVNIGQEWNGFWFGWSREKIGSAQLHKDAYARMYTEMKDVAGDALLLALATIDFAFNGTETNATSYTWDSTFNEWMVEPQYNDFISFDYYFGSGIFGDGKPIPSLAQQRAVWSRLTTGVDGDAGPLTRVIEFADRISPQRGILIAELGVSRIATNPYYDGWHTSPWFSEQFFRWMRHNGVWPQFFNSNQPDGDSRVQAGSVEATLVRQHFGPNPIPL